MCFNPTASLLTAVIEFLFAAILITFVRQSDMRNFFAAFITILGAYQFTEFMLCTSGNPVFWATSGIVAYSFLPAIALHGTLKFVGKKASLPAIYAIPAITTALALLIPNFVTGAACKEIFVEVHTFFNSYSPGLGAIPFFLYVAYYFSFIFMACFIAMQDFLRQRSRKKKIVEILEVAGVLLMTVPTVILLVIFPFIGVSFPSILCHFAILLAVTAFIGAIIESKTKYK